MPQFHVVTDPDDPAVAPFRAIKERDLVGRQGLFIAGLAVGAVGGIIAAVGGGVGSAVQHQEGTGYIRPADLNSAVAGRALTTAGFIGAGVGAATAIVGAIVWGTAPAEKPKTEITVTPMTGGAMVQVGGQF